MKLTEKYVHAVTKLLPEAQRQDIDKELRGLIEDMMDQKGGYTEENEMEVLKELGHPRALADKYLDKPQYLIGPELYGTYLMLLKVVIPIAVVAMLIGTTIEGFTTDQELVDIFSLMFGGMFNAAATTFGWITIIFALIERKSNGQFIKEIRKEWNPKDLPEIEKPYRPISRVGTLIGIGFLLVFVIIVNKYMHLVGVYYKEGAEILFIPVFDADLFRSYLPYINGIFALQILLAIAKLVYNKWTYPLAAANLAINLLAMILALMVLRDPTLIDFNVLAKIPALQGEIPDNAFNMVRTILQIVMPISYLIDSAEGFHQAYKSTAK